MPGTPPGVHREPVGRCRSTRSLPARSAVPGRRAGGPSPPRPANPRDRRRERTVEARAPGDRRTRERLVRRHRRGRGSAVCRSPDRSGDAVAPGGPSRGAAAPSSAISFRLPGRGPGVQGKRMAPRLLRQRRPSVRVQTSRIRPGVVNRHGRSSARDHRTSSATEPSMSTTSQGGRVTGIAPTHPRSVADRDRLS